MDKKLPKIYVNIIDKVIDNNDKIYYSKKNELKKEPTLKALKERAKSIKEKIAELFNSPNFVYKINATIILKDGKEINKDIIGQKDNVLIAIDDEEFMIEDIKDLKF